MGVGINLVLGSGLILYGVLQVPKGKGHRFSEPTELPLTQISLS